MPKKLIINFEEMDFNTTVERIRKLDGAQLENVYSDICAVSKRLKIKNGSELMRRQIYQHIQKKKYGDMGRKYKNQMLRLCKDVGLKTKFTNKIEPADGTVFKRTWKDRDYIVENKDGVYYLEGETFQSLSAVAKHITGHERSGPVFFGLKKRG